MDEWRATSTTASNPRDNAKREIVARVERPSVEDSVNSNTGAKSQRTSNTVTCKELSPVFSGAFSTE